MIARPVLFIAVLVASAGRSGEPIALKHGDLVTSVVFSPDSKMLYTGGHDDIVRAWRVPDGKEIWRVPSRERNVSWLALSPDGKRLATVGMVRRLSIRDPETGAEVRAVETRRSSNRSLACSPDGKRLAVSSHDFSITFVDLETLKPVGPVLMHESHPYQVRFSPDGRVLGSASGDNTARLWDTTTGKQLLRATSSGGMVQAVGFSPDNRHFAWGDRGGVVLQDFTGKRSQTLGEHGRMTMIVALAFTPDGRYVAAAGRPGMVVVYEVRSGEEVAHFREQTLEISDAAFSPDGRWLAYGLPRLAIIQDWQATSGLRVVPKKLSAEERGRLWDDLASRSGASATAAVGKLSAAPDIEDWLRKSLLAPYAAAPRPFKELIAGLESPRFAVRESAMRELKRSGPQTRESLRAVLKGKPSLDLRKRIEQLLREIDSDLLSTPELREVRAVHVLERLATPAARELLKDITRKVPDTVLSAEASAALERLAKASAKKE